ncbi:tetratricopeptide repeat protein [Candidatus Tisiphia endosymbiont of Melanophora roralis]|uniref:tetratricopeptide repeat protein n=1 Tax=Candidatus Tisiphia endosymbiont of Melanophora roralis TaxID=3066261 RepID=UPI001E7960CB|nr:MAG: tetratricopeptide repeat protein [Rickettsia endosymbiont of Cimex lectularius]
MKKFLTLFLLIIYSNTFAQEQVSNLITPVSYFVNHEQQLKTIKGNLSKYKQTSLVGTSGIGKTQLSRMYAYENNYDLIWFFDCNLDLNEQFVKLAKQLNSTRKTNISEEVALAKKEVISYLTSTNKWLLVFDNLKVNENKKVQDLIDWEHNGHVAFCSQDNEKLPNIIAMTLLDRPTIVALANNLLDNKDNNSIEFLTQSFSGYPILIVQGTQLLNKIKGLDKEEYKKKIYQATDKIATNINMVIQQLKPSAIKLLNKIALLNNQSFSKQLLTTITDNPDTLNDDIYQLSKFMLISNIDSNEDNPVFEMHDIVSNKIIELNGDNNKIYLENIITKLPKSKTRHLQYAWMTANTILGNLTILLNNSEKYNIDLYAMLKLRSELLSLYINVGDNSKIQQMVDWFNQKNQQIKLWQMPENYKFYYSRYLGAIGIYNGLKKDFETAISYFTKSLEVLYTLDNDEGKDALIFNLIHQICITYIEIGEIKLAEELLKKIEKLATQEVEHIYTIYFLKAYLFYTQGKYNEALEYRDQSIELLIENGFHANDLYLSRTYIYRAMVLNCLGRYQEAYAQAQQLYDMRKPIKHEDHEIFADIYTEMARSELGLGKIDKASEYINKAILLAEENNNSENINYSKNSDLAASYVVQGDILFAQDRLKQAIESYKKSFIIYHYLYGNRSKNVAQVSELYNKGAKAACKSKDLYNYKFFGKPQIKEFGIHHPNTVDMFEYCKQYNMDLWSKNH